MTRVELSFILMLVCIMAWILALTFMALGLWFSRRSSKKDLCKDMYSTYSFEMAYMSFACMITFMVMGVLWFIVTFL